MGVMKMRLNGLINTYYDELNKNDLHILHFFIQNIAEGSSKTVNEVAILCNVSPSTIIRMTQKLGFQGYSEFKYYLVNEEKLAQQETITKSGYFEKSILLKDAMETVKLFEQNSEKPHIYQAILGATRIFAYGTGYSQNLMLQELARCLLNNNIYLTIIPSQTELRLVSQSLQKDDLLLVASLSGNISNIQDSLQSLVVRKVPIISVTLLTRNELSYLSTYNLYYQVTSLNTVNQLNNSSFLTLNFVLGLLYEGVTNYIIDQRNDIKIDE